MNDHEALGLSYINETFSKLFDVQLLGSVIAELLKNNTIFHLNNNPELVFDEYVKTNEARK